MSLHLVSQGETHGHVGRMGFDMSVQQTSLILCSTTRAYPMHDACAHTVGAFAEVQLKPED